MEPDAQLMQSLENLAHLGSWFSRFDLAYKGMREGADLVLVEMLPLAGGSDHAA